MSKLDKLNAYARRWGWRRTAYAIVMRAATKVLGLEVYVLRICEAPEQSLDSPCQLAGVTFRLVSDEELLSTVDDIDLLLRDEFVRSAMDRGDLAFGAFHEGVLIAYVWCSTGTAFHYKDCWVRVMKPYSYSYNSFTRPEFRGQRLVPALLMYADQEMRKKGYTHRVGIVAVTNFASLRAGKHMGTQNIGHVGFMKWFGRYHFFRSGPAAEIGFQFFQPSREQSSLERSRRKSST
jgi:ribosomal protein S18 acetylase RimI-like enzyme